MAFSIGHLLTAAGQGASGYMRGKTEADQRREERERQARQEAMQQSMFDYRKQTDTLTRARLAEQDELAKWEARRERRLEAADRTRAAGQQKIENLHEGQRIGIEADRAAQQSGTLTTFDVNGVPHQVFRSSSTGEPIGEPWKATTPGAANARAKKPVVDSAVAGSIYNTVTRMNQLLDRDATAAYLPATAAVAQALSRIKILGVSPGAAFAGVGLTDNQRIFQQLSWEYSHNYTAALPKSRATPTFTGMIKETFFPIGPAQSNPSQVANYREEWTKVAERFRRAAMGEDDLSDLPGFDEMQDGSYPGSVPPSQEPPAGTDDDDVAWLLERGKR